MLHDDDALASPTGEATPPPSVHETAREQDKLGVDERRLREEIGFYSHLLVDLGLLEFKGGNLSVRIDDDMLITKRSVAKAIPSPDDIVRTSDLPRGRGRLPGIERDGDPSSDLQGDRCEGRDPRPSEQDREPVPVPR